MFKSLIRKIVLPSVGILLLLLVFISLFTYFSISQFARDVAQNNARVVSRGIRTYVEEFEQHATAAAHILASNQQFIRLVQSGSHSDLSEFLNATKESLGIDFYVVQDNEARVLIRTHDLERYGDIAATPQWEAARDGVGVSNYHSSRTTPMAYSTRAPILYNGEFVGVIIANLHISNPAFMDRMREIYNAELTFYFGDRAVASTWMDLDGEEDIHADEEIAQTVLQRLEGFERQIDIHGVSHSAYYFPLFNSDNEVSGMIAAAFSAEFEEEMVADLMRGSTLIGLGIVAIAIIVLSIIISNIVKPIKESGERTQLMFDATPLIIEYWDKDGNILDCNQTAIEYYGITDKENYFRATDDFYSWDIIDAFLEDVLENGSGSITIDDPQPDGSVVCFEIDAVRVIRDGKPVVMTYSHDVTMFRKLQDEQQDLVKRLETANSAKSRFLSNMSHEIRTPMNAIIGMTDIAKNTDDVAKKDDCIGKIAKASVHLLGIVNQILDISKIEAEQFKLDSHTFNIKKMVDEVLSVLSVGIDEKRLDIEVELDEAIPRYIVSDEVRLAQVFTNLLGNAVKFTPEGGRVSLSAKLIDDGSFMRVEVSDTGIGIPEARYADLFDDFVQIESDLTRRYAGTGLGLAISKRIVEMMGGRIWVESESEKGSRFIFTFPFKEGDIADEESHSLFFATSTQDIEPDCLKGFTILLAEDVEINCEIVISLLESTGVVIECAADGVEALQMFIDDPDRYDLILMDVQMPRMDGLTATRLIREIGTEKAKSIPIVALTANAFKEDIAVCIEAGMNDHLSKPLDLGRLLAKLRLYL